MTTSKATTDTVKKAIEEVDGWEAMDLDGDRIKETQATQIKQARSIASRYHRVFAQNEDGKQVLQDMIQKTILRATVQPNSTQFEAGIREGRADMVRQILQNIEIAESE